MTYHIVPCSNDRLHVQIARKERNDTIWHNLTIFNKNAAKIADYSGIVSDFETGANCHLIASTSYYLWSQLKRSMRTKENVTD